MNIRENIAPLPSVTAAGDPSVCGAAVGSQSRSQVEHSLNTYRKTFALCGISWDQAIAKSAGCREIVRQHCPHLLEELQGLAEGSGFEEEALFTLNCRTEILPSDFLVRAMASSDHASKDTHANECTSFAFARDESPVWLSQNWDWVGMQRQALVVVHSQPANSPAYITVTEAGMLAKIGLNEHGLGVTLNILRSNLDGQQAGMPVHFLLRALLDCKSVSDACEFASDLPYASSSNIMIADSSGDIASLEVSPEGCRVLKATQGQICHTNHFLHPELAANDAGKEGNISTVKRLKKAEDNISGINNFEDIKTVLSNTQDGAESICRFADETLPEIAQIETVVGVAMNLSDKTLWVSGAQPSISDFKAHSFDIADA